MADSNKALRDHLLYLLGGGGAHLNSEKVISGLPPKLRGTKPKGAPHSPWELLEHVRIAQWDILEFSRNPKHVSPDWPSGYWPKASAPPNATAWEKSANSFQKDLESMVKLVTDSKTNLAAKIPHGSGQTILREALLVA